ncbi:kinase-like protein [Pholiota conissans]|uniref:non-specific serine/threonine protein kinase n=1 Tax=Pholiota conissans TaxID=109636 RepID=A0A9P6CVM4_9AGAR|nr:kinase-like protein [Pholiota conissans]
MHLPFLWTTALCSASIFLQTPEQLISHSASTFCFQLFTKIRSPFLRSHAFPPPAIRRFSASRVINGGKLYNSDGLINFQITYYKHNGEGEELQVDKEPHFLPASKTYGYNPLKIGDRLVRPDGKKRIYEVVRKLGYGTSSSVWLVRSDDAGAKIRFLALKILITKSSMIDINKPEYASELVSSIVITHGNSNHPGYAHCIQLCGEVACKSRHGQHACLAFDAMGSDMATLQEKQPNRAFSSLVTKRIIKQILLVLDYIHGDCSRVHTDLSLQNIMVSLNASDATIAEYLDKHPAFFLDIDSLFSMNIYSDVFRGQRLSMTTILWSI